MPDHTLEEWSIQATPVTADFYDAQFRITNKTTDLLIEGAGSMEWWIVVPTE